VQLATPSANNELQQTINVVMNNKVAAVYVAAVYVSCGMGDDCSGVALSKKVHDAQQHKQTCHAMQNLLMRLADVDSRYSCQ
jgi:hypothetical protein